MLLRLTRAAPHELAASLWSFVYFFALLAGYYVLRPIRDEMAIQAGQDELQALFTAVFVAMLVLVPVFGGLMARFPRRRLLPWIYAFFVANLLAFHGLFVTGGVQSPWVARAFFVWVSVFNLFAVSVFWSLMADLFDTAQAKRLYGFIAAGGTIGALTGPSLTALFVTLVGVRSMLLVSAAFLALAVVAIIALRRWAERTGAAGRTNGEPAIGGTMWGGMRDIVRSPYLIGICLFLFGYSLLSTFLYFQQAELVPAALKDSAERTRLLALTDLAVNVLTLAVQLFAFGTLIRRLGTGFMLCAMPAVACAGFARARDMADAGHARRVRRGAPCRRVRDQQAGARDAVQRTDARGEVQGEKRDRHARAPHGRYRIVVDLHRTQVARPDAHRDELARRADRGPLARCRRMARPRAARTIAGVGCSARVTPLFSACAALPPRRRAIRDKGRRRRA